MPDKNLSYNSYGQKYQVPRVLVSSLNDLQKADHCALHRYSGAYWHHFIVESINYEASEIHAIEYSNTAQGFCTDNCIPPKAKFEIAKVVRTIYKFQDEDVYLLKYGNCLDPDVVVSKAQKKVGVGKYNPLTNNCEHFAMWCKTGTSSSDQINKAKAQMLTNPELGPLTSVGAAGAVSLANQTVTKGGRGSGDPNCNKSGTGDREDGDSPGFKGSDGPNCNKSGTGDREDGDSPGYNGSDDSNCNKSGTEDREDGDSPGYNGSDDPNCNKSGTEDREDGDSPGYNGSGGPNYNKSGTEDREDGDSPGYNESGDPNCNKSGTEDREDGDSPGYNGSGDPNCFKSRTGGREYRDSLGYIEAVAQTASELEVGLEALKTGIHQATQKVFTQTGSNSGQTIMKTVARKTTEEVLIRTGSEAGQEVVKTGVREVSEEVVAQTVSQPEAGLGGSLVAGALCAAAVEGVLMTRDIRSMYSDMKDGKIDRNEFISATGKRAITGVGNVGGSTVGTVIGQALIPVPFLGGVVGAFVGGVTVKFIGNIMANSLL